MITFFNLAQKAVETGNEDKKVSWSTIKTAMPDLIYKISCMKFQDPATGEDKVVAAMKALQDEIQQAFRNLDS